MPPLRLTLAQLNVTVGDLDGNRRRIEEAIRCAEAWRADLVVVPELAVTGYPPEDLLLKPRFVEANLETLARLVPSARRVVALVGFVDRDQQGRLYNAAAILAEGRHVATYRKQYLPNYGVFDEKRYFTAGTESCVLDLGGPRLGVTICEDLWEEEPCRVLASAGVRLIVNLSSSPYHAGKLKVRERLFARRAREHGLAIAYCNLVGGQDELIFDGASLVLDARGRVVAQAAQFREDALTVDITPAWLHATRLRAPRGGRIQTVRLARVVPDRARLPRHWAPDACFAERNTGGPHGDLRSYGGAGCRPHRGRWWGATGSARGAPPTQRRSAYPLVEEVYEALTLGLRDYVRKNGFTRVVLGLSGGIDSALTACLALDALGPASVVGVVMPSRYSSRATQEDARALALALGIELYQISIEPMFRSYLATLAPVFRGRRADSTEQNIQARIRGNLLMALSNKFGWLVLTTGNKSEFATGYCTLYGDMAGGFAVIKDVPKTLVYQLATFRNRKTGPIPKRVFRRAPTAELAPHQTDQDTLPPYDVLDRILKAYVEEDRSIRDILGANQVRPETVSRVLQMVDRSEYKRRQGAPGIKITPKAFGKDRRMPITNRYHQNQ